MSFRRAIIALGTMMAAIVPAAAQEARKVQIAYEITFAGISGFRIDVTARFNGSSYDVETTTYKEGMLKAVTMNYFGRNRAWGGFSTRGAEPTAGSLSISVDGKPRTWLVQYGAAGFLQETHTPTWNPTPQQTISEADRKDSLDPLSAALSVGFAGDAACDRTVRSNDGKRRIDILFRRIGMEPAGSTGIAGAIGDVLVCEIFTKRVAGEFDEAPKEAEPDADRPLARFDNTHVRYPGKLEAHTLFATIRGRILSFQETPLTEEEIRAMRR